MLKPMSDRTGNIQRQTTGYDAFIPKELMPNGPAYTRDTEYERLISEAYLKLGELNGITQVLPDPDLFVAFYVQKEALLSSQIEGTQSSMDEVIQVDEQTKTMKPVDEVVNYVHAMNTGLRKMNALPFSTRLLHLLHERLMDGVRGQEKLPGQYKTRQNWIGPEGCNLNEALFVPPPPHLVEKLMGDLENYYHCDDTNIPSLIRAAIVHYQFETIHPYADGNGRLGRLIITLMLVEKGLIDKPLLYLSLFFKEHRQKYYNLLMDVRLKGSWEEWFKFFLRGVRHTSTEAVTTAKDILRLIKDDKDLISKQVTKSKNIVGAYERICRKPVITISNLAKDLNVSFPTAQLQIELLQKLGILIERSQKERDRIFSYEKYLEILRRGT
jgi:Fic family protein